MPLDITDWIDDDDFEVPGDGPVRLQYRWLGVAEFTALETRLDAMQRPGQNPTPTLAGEVSDHELRNQEVVREALQKYVRIRSGQFRDVEASDKAGHDVWLTDGADLMRIWGGRPALVLLVLQHVLLVNRVSKAERGNSLRRLDSIFFSPEPPVTPAGDGLPTVPAASEPASAPSVAASDPTSDAPSGTTDPSCSSTAPDASAPSEPDGPSAGSTSPTPSDVTASAASTT